MSNGRPLERESGREKLPKNAIRLHPYRETGKTRQHCRSAGCWRSPSSVRVIYSREGHLSSRWIFRKPVATEHHDRVGPQRDSVGLWITGQHETVQRATPLTRSCPFRLDGGNAAVILREPPQIPCSTVVVFRDGIRSRYMAYRIDWRLI